MKLTIAIPTFNRSTDLNNLLTSIEVATLSFLHKDTIEVLVIDNNSDDDTADICNSFTNRISNFKFFINSTNIGLTGNLNECISKSSGEFLWLIGDDETISENSLEIIYSEFYHDLDMYIFNYSSEPFDSNQKFLNFNHNRPVYTRTDKLYDLVMDWGWLWCLGNLGMIISRRSLLNDRDFSSFANCNFGQASWYFEGFHDKNVKFLDIPIFRTYIKSQTVNKERWKTDDTSIKFLNIYESIHILISKGCLPPQLPFNFFNGCSADVYPIWGYILSEIKYKILNNNFHFDQKYFDSIFNMIALLNDLKLRASLLSCFTNLILTLNSIKVTQESYYKNIGDLPATWSSSTDKLLSFKR